MIGKPDMANIIRLQLALMRPNVSDIRIHVDTGGYATHAHRLHIPIMTNAGVSFDLCPFLDAEKTKQVRGRLDIGVFALASAFAALVFADACCRVSVLPTPKRRPSVPQHATPTQTHPSHP